MKAAVVLFSYGGVLPETVESLIFEMQEWPFYFQQYWNAAALDRNRSMMASRFLDSDADVFISIDHDTQWQRGAVAKLAKAASEKRGIVGGVYSKRHFGRGIATRFLESGEYLIPSEEVIKARWVGGGFLAVHRDVLEAMKPTLPECFAEKPFWPFFLPMVVEGEYLSEDWAFCERARELGFDVYADLSIALTHVGQWGFTVQNGVTRLPENGQVKVQVA